jgi:asparagine synthase (glutamine-hydrolysing)
MIADVPVGAFLSGGVDSSIITTLMQEIRGDKKIKTFTVGFDTLTEAAEAKETSDFLGTDHTEIKIGSDEYFSVLSEAVYHFDEPIADPSAVGLYFVAREARKHVKVVLSGEGSDELFGGYNIYLAPFAKQKMAWLPKSVTRFLIDLPFDYYGKNYLKRVNQRLDEWYFGQKYFSKSIFDRNEIQQMWKGEPQKFISLKQLYKKTTNSDSTEMQYVDINTWLVGDILAKADKMTMANSLELRVPFLDKDVAELAKTLPDNFKWKGNVTKYLLREAFATVIPESTRNRRKLGFPTPIKSWLTKDRRDVYQIILSNKYIKQNLDIKYVEKLISDHVENKVDNSRKIYTLLMLSLWYNRFII